MRELFSAGLSNGCALSVHAGGEHIAHLWGGFSDRELRQAWHRDTLVNVFSASKGILSAVILELAQDRQLDLDTPIADYWPAFATGGKQTITTREVLNHRAGLCAFQHFVAREDCFHWPAMKQHVEAMRPIEALRGVQAYAPFTFGWILGGLIEALTGHPPHDYVNQQIREGMGLDFHLALDDSTLSRVAPVLPKATAPKTSTRQAANPSSAKARQKPNPEDILLTDQRAFERALHAKDWRTLAFENPRSLAGGSNSSAWRRAGVPAAGGHCSADALARFYRQLGQTLKHSDQMHLLQSAWSAAERDGCTGAPMSFAGGFMFSRPGDAAPLTPSGIAIGHAGAGGSLGVWDMEHDIAIGFVTRDLSPSLLAGGKAQKLIANIYRCLQLH